jgi:hypothetical protein
VGGDLWSGVVRAASVRGAEIAMGRVILRWTIIVALVSLARAQTIDLGGYQLSSEAFGLTPVFDHDLRGVIRCGDVKSANARVDLLKLHTASPKVASRLPSLQTNSDERGSFRLWVPEGDWMLIVRATCQVSAPGFAQTMFRVGHEIHVSRGVSGHSIRELNVEMQTGEMRVVKDGETEMTTAMRGGKGKDPIY